MKHRLIRAIQIATLLLAFAAPAFAQESKRGIFNGDLPDGGKVVFFVEGNNGLSAYVFDGNNHVSLGSAALDPDGSFTLTTNDGESITGTIGSTAITVTFRGQTFTINGDDIVGPTAPITGRFKGWARSDDGGGHINVTLLVDSEGHVFLVGKNGSYFGGFGDITIEPGETDDDGKDEDEKNNKDKDPHGLKFHVNFSIQTSIGTIRGNVNLNPSGLHGHIQIGDFKFVFRAFRDGSGHHFGNISTRGFVNIGQGQLIAGFIVTGGPKLVLIRALGPSLAAQGVTPVLADPTVSLFRESTVVAQNDNWQSGERAAAIEGIGIAPPDAKESALLVQLEPGAYTAVVSGAEGGTGIALVEFYEIERE